MVQMRAKGLLDARRDPHRVPLDDGAPVARSSWSDDYRRACKAAGIDGRTRTHDLRHVAASVLIASGLSVKAVQGALGHSSASETLDVYSHFWPSDEEPTRAAIGQGSLRSSGPD